MVVETRKTMPGAATISPYLGALISQVVEEYVRARGWGPESYDLWYHDEPLWFIRDKTGREHIGTRPSAKNGALVVTRVQISPFTSSAGLELMAMPDAYVYDPTAKRVTAKASASDRSRGRQTRSVQELEWWLANSERDEAEQAVRSMIDAAWYEAARIKPHRVADSRTSTS